MKSTITRKGDFVLDATCKTYRRPEYNGLQDPNLSSFFASPRRRKLLVVQKLILPNGQINEMMCKKRVTDFYQSSNMLKKSNFTAGNESYKVKSHTPNFTRNLKVSRSPETTKVAPVTAAEFKEMIYKRRELLKD